MSLPSNLPLFQGNEDSVNRGSVKRSSNAQECRDGKEVISLGRQSQSYGSGDYRDSPRNPDLIGYNRPPFNVRKSWTPLKSDYETNAWGGVTLKKTTNGRRVVSGIKLESPITPNKPKIERFTFAGDVL